MWLITEFEAASLFSLKMSSATSSGGKTLLVPTPFAVKMALLDAAFRARGADEAERLWEKICALQIALRPSARVVVTNLFQKVLRPRGKQAALEGTDAGPFQKTIGYREYAQWVGALGIGFQTEDERASEWLIELLLNVNYLGKRGGFVQWLPPGRWEESLPSDFVEATQEQQEFSLNGTLQVLDDSAAGLDFERVNIYDASPLRKQDRVLRQIVLANFRMTRSSKSFSLYERVE
ncbi:MAG: hypothetical protein B6D41_11280 [Chloroflexi bacterium UTCFX4]|jgi:hypothetical protein|nr:MAG: hypothetical protein B6D41_11280 [Chloroflexi bacterium UTCFX4]